MINAEMTEGGGRTVDGHRHKNHTAALSSRQRSDGQMSDSVV